MIIVEEKAGLIHSYCTVSTHTTTKPLSLVCYCDITVTNTSATDLSLARNILELSKEVVACLPTGPQAPQLVGSLADEVPRHCTAPASCTDYI